MPLPWYYHLLTPDWMQHRDLADVLERQQSDANSLERRVELLERQLQDQQRHIQGLEALLAAPRHYTASRTGGGTPSGGRFPRPHPGNHHMSPVRCPVSGETGTAATSAVCLFNTNLNEYGPAMLTHRRTVIFLPPLGNPKKTPSNRGGFYEP